MRRGLVIVTLDLFAPGHPQSSTCLGSHNAQLLIKAHSYLLLTLTPTRDMYRAGDDGD